MVRQALSGELHWEWELHQRLSPAMLLLEHVRPPVLLCFWCQHHKRFDVVRCGKMQLGPELVLDWISLTSWVTSTDREGQDSI